MSQSESLGDALLAARRRAVDAEREFLELLREAHQRGAAWRDLGELLGIPFTTLYRWADTGVRRRKRADVLGLPR